MARIFSRDSAPSHLFNIRELDFSGDLFAERISSQWFRLGAWTIGSGLVRPNLEDVTSRQSILMPVGGFIQLFDELESIGNDLHGLGKPHGSVTDDGTRKEY